MSSREKGGSAVQPVRETALRVRQRRKLIDACISALHAYGPSRTTIDKVVQIADMSPGIVNFYFDTKAAMLVAALEFLSAEFEQQVLAPVAAIKDTPVRALEALIDLYFDPELASPRKVSVWYAFWGEANSRQEYHDICGAKDDSFAALVHDLIARLIAETAARHLDADGVALGLIGALEVLWQHIAFQDESDIDRAAFKRRCLAYLGSVFPGRFAAAAPAIAAPAPPDGPSEALPRWAYHDPDLFGVERDALFLDEWRFVGREIEMPGAGDYLTLAVAGERAFALRGEGGEIRAFRNACLRRPHALARGASGHFTGAIRCPADRLEYSFDGALRGAEPGGGLTPVGVRRDGGLIFIRLGGGTERDEPPPIAPAIDGLMLRAPPEETDVAADWKVVVEQWLEGGFAPDADGRLICDSAPAVDGWTAKRYHAIAQDLRGHIGWRRAFHCPDLLIETRPDGVTILQVLPLAPGLCRIRRLRYGLPPADRRLAALAYLSRRWEDRRLALDIETAQSTQSGLTAPLYEPRPMAGAPARAARRFWAWLRARLPHLNEA
jgi:TetR/AcrR family transcriptional repressor of bet genes